MKKLIAIVLALVLVLSLAACGAGDSGVKTYKVGVAIYQYNDNFMTLYRQEIENYFKTLETDKVKYEVTMVDGKNDMAEQTNQIDTFITQKMDVIICNLVQTSSAEVIIDKVVAADIPLILINREPLGETDESYPGIINNAKVCYVGADARQSGTYQGEIVLALDNKGDINGDGVVKYVMVVGDPENPDAQYRTEFSVKALTDAGLTVN
jgi:methyl-galactoside transport system substrate-binding protein